CLLMEAKYDSALLGILQHEGKIEKFLDVVFGFLMRRTDFYHIMTPDQKKLGFPPGVSLRMVVRVSYSSDTPMNSSKETLETGQADVPPVSTLEVQSTESMKPEILPNTDRDADDTPGVYQADPECYNGAICDSYTWSQSIKDVDINIKVPSVVKTGKDLKVVVDRKRVRVFIKSDGTEQTYFDRSLCWDVVKDEAVWTLQPKESQKVHDMLVKAWDQEGSPFRGTPFDPSKINIAPS
ncbi:uncharacterized protein DEA37_0005533, partial [Paragonimus westermani]